MSGTVVDATGAVIPGALVHLDPAPVPGDQEHRTDSTGDFLISAPPGRYIVTVEASGFGRFTSGPLTLKPNARIQLPIHLEIASLRQQLDVVEEEGAGEAAGRAGALTLEGDSLKVLANDPALLQQQLTALAGGMPSILIDGFSNGRLPPKSTIRSIRLNSNAYSSYYADYASSRVEISTKPGTDQLHGALDLSGTDQPLDARNPYLPLALPFYDVQQDGNISGSFKKFSYFFSDAVESLANNAVVNAANPQAPSTLLSEGLPAPQRTDTFSSRIDRQFSTRNFGYVRDEWSETHILNSGIDLLVLPASAYTANTLTNTLQLADTQVLNAHAVNDVRFQYLRTRVRQDPNSTLPSVIVQGAFQDGGSASQVLRDNQDAYELQEMLDFDRGAHSFRMGFRVRAGRDANESSAGFNGQYIFPDTASYLAGTPTQFSITRGSPEATIFNEDLGVYIDDDWKVSPTLTLSYGFRYETESAIPDHSDPAPRIGFSWAIRPGKRKVPVVTLRGGYGVFYDRFPQAQLLQAIRQNGVREIAYVAQGTGFNAQGPPPGVDLAAGEPTTYQVNPGLRSSYAQMASISVLRSLGRYGRVSGAFFYSHNTHNFLTRNINAPLPGTYSESDPSTAVRPLGNTQNIYQFSSDANGNLERFSVNYQVRAGSRLFAFGRFNLEKNYGETDGITQFPSNQYDLRADYGRLAIARPVVFTGGLTWTLPHGLEVTPFLDARTGIPFNITTGADRNGDTIYNDRPAPAAQSSGPSVVPTVLGNFNVAPGTAPTIARNSGTAPGLVWLDLRAAKSIRLGPLPKSGAPAEAAAAASPVERPWELRFSLEAQNVFNHNNPGLPVGTISAEPCGTANTVPCACPGAAVSACPLSPSTYFGHSLSLANDFSPVTASNRTIFLQTSFTF